MYSKEIDSKELQEWIEVFPNKQLKIHKKLRELHEILLHFPPTDKSFFVLEAFPEKVSNLLEKITFLIEKQLERKNKPFVKFYLTKIYFQLFFIIGSIRTMTDNHVVYYQREAPPHYEIATAFQQEEEQVEKSFAMTKGGGKFLLKIFCLNPRDLFAEYLKLAKSAVFFSATLHPFDYFCEILAEKEKDNRLTLLSPFDRNNFGLFVYTGINTMYQYRENAYQPLADLILSVCSQKQGNYLIYFPSFSFLNNVYDLCKMDDGKHRHDNIICQKSKMSERERKEFLNLFEKQDQTMIAFAVMGGIFGEGIDLIGNKLIGCMIISVGLPSLGGEKALLKDYYDQALNAGFEYAYRYPGFNKVMQAAGRVIRSETDQGIVVLVDQRYGRTDYKELYPPDWLHYKAFNNQSRLISEIEKFWHNQ
jgi:DNA excision repair protein ERCC-2